MSEKKKLERSKTPRIVGGERVEREQRQGQERFRYRVYSARCFQNGVKALSIEKWRAAGCPSNPCGQEKNAGNLWE